MGQAVGIKDDKTAGEGKEGTEEAQAVENADGVSDQRSLSCVVDCCNPCL